MDKNTGPSSTKLAGKVDDVAVALRLQAANLSRQIGELQNQLEEERKAKAKAEEVTRLSVEQAESRVKKVQADAEARVKELEQQLVSTKEELSKYFGQLCDIISAGQGSHLVKQLEDMRVEMNKLKQVKEGLEEQLKDTVSRSVFGKVDEEFRRASSDLLTAREELERVQDELSDAHSRIEDLMGRNWWNRLFNSRVGG